MSLLRSARVRKPPNQFLRAHGHDGAHLLFGDGIKGNLVMPNTPQPSLPPTAARALMPDLIRAFALIGIALVNVLIFAWPPETGLPLETRTVGADGVAYFTTHALFTMKSYPLFSMMFGAGLAYQMLSAERAGKAFAPRYYRRMLGLFVLGLIHFVFFWIGDILMTYATLGAAFFFLRDVNVRSLIITGCILIAVNAGLFGLMGGAMWLGETFAPEDMPGPEDFEARREYAMVAFADGSFYNAAAYRARNLVVFFFNNLMFQGLGVMGFFCFGLAAVKAKTIDAPDARIWRLGRDCVPAYRTDRQFGGRLVPQHSGLHCHERDVFRVRAHRRVFFRLLRSAMSALSHCSVQARAARSHASSRVQDRPA